VCANGGVSMNQARLVRWPAASRVMSTFQAKGIAPTRFPDTTDAEVIKAYVAAGLGIATFAGDRPLTPSRMLPASAIILSI